MSKQNFKTIAENRKARHEYFVIESMGSRYRAYGY